MSQRRAFLSPPQRFRIKNPFERALVDSLDAPMCSPGMFKIRESSGSFKWDIEQVAILKPADIEACSSQFAATPDPALEKKAKDAIEQFFSQDVIVPSPLSVVIKKPILPIERTEKTSYSDGCTQTELTFPAILPLDIENALKPYYSNAAKESDADISANASLRRKLCFEEFSDEDDISIMEHMQYTSGTPMRALKRTLDSSFENSIISNSEINTVAKALNMSNYDSTSPLCDSMLRHSNEIGQKLESPSLSPIRRVSDLQKDHQKISDPSNNSHDCNSSIFSQSTPEKSDNASKSLNLSSNTLDTSETELVKVKFNDDMSQFGKNNLKINKCSQSMLSICTTGRNISQLNTDQMDISCEFSYSRNQSPIGDSVRSSQLEMQMSGNTVVNFDSLSKNQILINPAVEMKATNDLKGSNICDKVQFINKNYLSDKSAMNCESFEQLSEIYQHLTPKKNSKEYLIDLIKSPIRKSSYMSLSSPTRMSLDNSFNIDTDKFFVREQPQHMNDSNTIQDATLYTRDFSYNSNKFEAIGKSGLQSMDSGYLEHLASANSTICNSMKYNSTLDATKSFQSNNEAASVRWKRFDSGFHDETSSDFNQQLNSNDSLKFNKKAGHLSEYLVDHEKLVDFNKYFDNGNNAQESMSMSGIFTDDLASMRNGNFSSTPSKNCLRK